MTSENLNIKIRLDLSDVTSGVKKVKTQLTGMTDKVKQSIPKINSESKKASTALSGVSKAGEDVKKTLDGIGREARDSLSDVVTQSNRVKAALKGIGSDGGKINIGFNTEGMAESTDEVNSSLESMQGTMSAILGLNFVEVLTKPLAGLKTKIAGVCSQMTDSLKSVTATIGSYFYNMNKGVKEANKRFSEWYKTVAKNNLKDIPVFIKQIGTQFLSLGKIIGGVTLKLAAFSSALLAVAGGMIAGQTKQYREEQAKLLSAFQAAGGGADEASQAYKGLFRFMGDSATAVEAANHLAKLTTNTKELAEWTTICQGIYATFGDSLRIEGLTEAANETARTGKVTGVLADALNWAGVQEDFFNEKLAQTTTLAEREALIRTTLNGLYSDAAALYERNNRAAIAHNEAQARLQATMGRIGQQTQVLLTSLTNLANTALTVLAPAISYVSAVFSVLIDKLAQAIQWLGALFGIKFQTDAIGGIVSGAGANLDSVAGSAGALEDNLNAATGAAEKLRKTTMGFDELNIVSNPQSSGGGSADVSGGGGSVDIPALNTGGGVLGQIGEQVELIKDKIEKAIDGFIEKYKTQIAIIGGALAALGIANLLTHLGKAIGLGDKFLATMGAIKKLAATVITIVLQYTLVNEFMDNFIDGEGFKEYLKGLLVAGIGTGVLYSMWGPAGLVIGLGVTAVASIKAVLDNGGITNVESLTVALTGLASAIGAVAIAWKKLGLGAAIAKVMGNVGAFFALLKEGNSITAVLAAAFPKVSAAISSVAATVSGAGSAITGFLGSIGSALGLSGGAAIAAGAAIIVAAIAAIVGVIVFLKENWEAVTKAVKDFFALNIAPQIDKMRESWDKVVTAVKKLGEAFANLGSLIWNALPEGLQEWLSSVAEEIKKVVAAIAEWFKSIDWLQAIGDVFEAIGGVIFGVISGVIMGAINLLVGAIEGLAQVITGVVEIVAGAVEAIVRLFSGDLQGAWEAVKRIGQGIVDVFVGLYDATIGAVIKFVEGIINWFIELWDELVGHSIVPDTIDAIVDWFWQLPTRVGEAVKKFVTDVINKFKEMWNNIKSWFNSVVAPKFTREYWNTKFDTIRQSISDKLNAAKTAASNIWNGITSWFNSTIAPKFTKQYWSTKFDAIRQGASEKLEAAKSTIQNVWNTVSSWFRNSVAPKFTVSYWTNKFNVIKDGAKAAFNGLIGIVERAINAIIRKLNTFQISIPSWVPGVGGRYFGINLNTISIPRLATGGIVTQSTFANIGEAGAEAVLPLENNTHWMDALADKIAARNSSPTKIVLNVDGRELGYATINSINGITKQTGGLQLQLA